MNKDRAKRLALMRQIPAFAQMDHRHFLDTDGRHPLLEAMPRGRRKFLERKSVEIAKKYNDLLNWLQKTGCGFPVDTALRDFAYEYNHRYASSGTQNQPVSFNYIEPFLQFKLIDKCAPSLVLSSETNHVFQIEDFFDYLTGPDRLNFSVADLSEIPDGQVLHFTANGDVLDFRFLSHTGNEFAVSGFSIVRRNQSIHWYLIGGEIFSESDWGELSANVTKINLEDITPPQEKVLRGSHQGEWGDCRTASTSGRN